MPNFARADFRYTAYFCEENAWWLARDLLARGQPPGALSVWFLVNRDCQVAMTQQRAAPPGALMCWDYHVIVRCRDRHADLILDFDTRLDFACETGDYLLRSFPRQSLLPAEYRASVREVAASDFVARFASDRSHMQGQLDPSAFPPYPPIRPADPGRAIDLADYRDPAKTLDDGSEVVPIERFEPRLD
jgi:hypothetical protein